MLMAQLHSKLPGEIWLGSEDLLTSAVMGTLKNLPAMLTVDLLARAQPLAGTDVPRLAAPLTWSFWPTWETCEPDVVVEDKDTVCIVEAKLYSDFGEDVGAGRQLRREYADGLHYARGAGKELWLVALTNHATMPRDAMQAQLGGSAAHPARVAWLSWLEVGRLLQSARGEGVVAWCEDLLELLRRMGLAPCEGFGRSLERGTLVSMAGLPWMEPLPLARESSAGAGFAPVLERARRLAGVQPWAWRRGGMRG
jgi:hypothetical protein